MYESQRKASMRYSVKTYNRYTVSFRKDSDKYLIDLIERNRAAGVSPSDTVRWMRICAGRAAETEMRWVVIEQVAGGDQFETMCANQQDAESKALDIWDHLTESERRRNTITVALVLLDEDGCCGDWVRTTDEYHA